MGDIEVLKYAALRASTHADAMESAVDELQDVLHRLQEEDVMIQECETYLQELLQESQRIEELHQLVNASRLQRAEGVALRSKEFPHGCLTHSTLSTGALSLPSSSSLLQCKRHAETTSLAPRKETRFSMKGDSGVSKHPKEAVTVSSSPHNAPISQKGCRKGMAFAASSSSCASPSIATNATCNAATRKEVQGVPSTSGLALWRQALTEEEVQRMLGRPHRTTGPRERSCGRGDKKSVFGDRSTMPRPTASLSSSCSVKASTTEPNEVTATKWTPTRTNSGSTMNASISGEAASLSLSSDVISSEKRKIAQEIWVTKRKLAFLDRTSLRSRLQVLAKAKARVLATPINDILHGKDRDHRTEDPEKEEEVEIFSFGTDVEALWSCDPYLSSSSSTSFLPFVEALLADGTQRLTRRYEDAMQVLVENVEGRTGEKEDPFSKPIPTPRATPLTPCAADLKTSPFHFLTHTNPVMEPQPFHTGKDLCFSPDSSTVPERGRVAPVDTNPSPSSTNQETKENTKKVRKGEENTGMDHGTSSTPRHPGTLSSSFSLSKEPHGVRAFMKDAKTKKWTPSTVPPKQSVPVSSSSSSDASPHEDWVGILSRLRSCYAYATLLSHEENQDAALVEAIKGAECETCTPVFQCQCDAISHFRCFKGWVPVAGERNTRDVTCLGTAVQENSSGKQELEREVQDEGLTGISTSRSPSPEKNSLCSRHRREIEEEQMKAMFTSIFSGDDYACLPASWPWMKELCATPSSFLLPPIHTIRAPRFLYADVEEYLVLTKTRMELQRWIAQRVVNGLHLVDISNEMLKTIAQKKNTRCPCGENLGTIKDVTVAEARLFVPKHFHFRDPFSWTTIVEDDDSIE